MRKIILSFVLACPALVLAADCGALSAKYQAPNPASKTMAQIERWVNNRVDDAGDATALKECLIAGAADNPNQASYAGK